MADVADSEWTPERVLDVKSWLPGDAYVEAAVVIVQYQRLAEDDSSERGPWLSVRRDTQHGAWNHLGMVESTANDLRAALLRIEDGT